MFLAFPLKPFFPVDDTGLHPTDAIVPPKAANNPAFKNSLRFIRIKFSLTINKQNNHEKITDKKYLLFFIETIIPVKIINSTKNKDTSGFI